MQAHPLIRVMVCSSQLAARQKLAAALTHDRAIEMAGTFTTLDQLIEANRGTRSDILLVDSTATTLA